MRFIYFFMIIDLLLSLISYFYLRKSFQIARSRLFLFLFSLLSLNVICSRLLPIEAPVFLSKLSYYMSGLWIAILFYLLIASIGHLLLYLVDKLFSLQLPHRKIASVFLAFIFCFVAWGSYKAYQPVVRTEKITTTKLAANQSYKVILLTDIHLGQLFGHSYAEKLVERINLQKPDLVLFSGDLLDEKISYVERENSLAPLKNIQSKHGTYLAFGNHDYLDRPELWQKMIEEQDITVLRDKDVIINDQIKITGLNDWRYSSSTSALEALSSQNNSYYSIVLDHQPRRMETAAALKYDLYLSGHTHTGQLFPNRQVTKRMYKLDYGTALFDKMTAITSSGYGLWGPPVRTEAAPEIVIIELTGK